MLQSRPPRFRPRVFVIPRRASSQRFQVAHCGIHPGYIFINKGASFNFSGRLVGDEILAEGWQLFEKLAAPPKKSHVWGEDFVTRTYQVIAIEGLHVNQSVRAVVHGIEEDLRSG